MAKSAILHQPGVLAKAARVNNESYAGMVSSEACVLNVGNK